MDLIISVRVQTLVSDFRQQHAIFDTRVRYWTQALVFGHRCPIYDTTVRLKALVSDFRHYRPILEIYVRFWTLMSDFRHKRLILKRSVRFWTRLSNFGNLCPVLDTRVLVSAFRPSVRLQTPMSHLRQNVYSIRFQASMFNCCAIFNASVGFWRVVSDFGHHSNVLHKCLILDHGHQCPILKIFVPFQTPVSDFKHKCRNQSTFQPQSARLSIYV